jgi:AraC family transcriptional regulator
MNWMKRLNQALKYVEQNLTGRLDVQDIASIANTSPFHFQKMFHILADITLAEYIRNRRLTLAAKEIVNGAGILDTALKYGYETQASFTRAFKRLHSFSPGMARDKGAMIKAYPPLAFHLTIQGEGPMEYEIREVGEFTIAGISRTFSAKDGSNYKDIPKYWDEMGAMGEIEKLHKKVDARGMFKGALLGACLGFSNEMEEFSYLIGIEPEEDVDLEGLKQIDIPALTWAVFKGVRSSPDAGHKIWKAIYGEWFPATDYIHDEGPELEISFDEKDINHFEIWIPVKKVAITI